MDKAPKVVSGQKKVVSKTTLDTKITKNKTTGDIKVPKTMVNQVIGQDEAVKIIKKAAQQRRHVLLIGEPGTGKSMLGIALAELLPKSELKDTLSYYNANDDNNP